MPRARHNLVSAYVDFRGLQSLITGRRNDAERIPLAARLAHGVLAEKLQKEIHDALDTAIRDGGRPQQREGRLLKAILDERNRHVTEDGYYVGRLDESWSGEVRQYYKGLEIGTSVFVGRYLRGAFLTEGGTLDIPRKGGRDPRFLQFGPIGPLLKDDTFETRRGVNASDPSSGTRPRKVRGVLIKNPIKPYHYTQTGFRNFQDKGYLGERAFEIYQDEFKFLGLRFNIRARNRGLGAADISTRTVGVHDAAPGVEPGRVR